MQQVASGPLTTKHERECSTATKQAITPWMLRTEGLRLSRKHIRAVLRQKGIRESPFKASEITAMAKRWLELNHAELIGQALGNLALKAEREKSRASGVQISGSK